jgi:hypothetical protein
MNTLYVYASPAEQIVFTLVGVLAVIGTLAVARRYP